MCFPKPLDTEQDEISGKRNFPPCETAGHKENMRFASSDLRVTGGDINELYFERIGHW